MTKGKCECGEVQYEFTGRIIDLTHCHCSQCRRLHGAAFASFGGVDRTNFHYVSGLESLKTYHSSQTTARVFCGNCGSNILVEYNPEPDILYIAMGTLDGKPDCPPAFHQFVASKAPWHEITDNLPRYDGWPDE